MVAKILGIDWPHSKTAKPEAAVALIRMYQKFILYEDDLKKEQDLNKTMLYCITIYFILLLQSHFTISHRLIIKFE